MASIVQQRWNVIGSFREKYYLLNSVNNNDTLVTGFKNIKWCDTNNPGGVTNDAPSGGTITFTVAAGPLNGVQVRVVGV